MAALSGIITNSLNAVSRIGIFSGTFPGALSQVRQYAHRKGYREKMKKKKVKKVVVKPSFAEIVRRSKKQRIIEPDALKYREGQFRVSEDDVYFQKVCRWKRYPFAEAIQCHREWLHPTMYGAPSSIVKAYVELNFQGIKKTKPVETFRKIVQMTHPFDHGEERKLLAFCKSEEDIKDALDAGASLAGGADIVKLILKGEISYNNYDVFVAHTSVMPDVLTLRGLLKRKHPNIKAGTAGVDMKSMVTTQLHGIKYTAEAWDNFPEYGRTTVSIGKLDMDIAHLEANLRDALNSIMESKPKRPGNFIMRVRIDCPPSLERFTIDHLLHVEDETGEEDPNKGDASDDEAEEEDVAVAASA